MPETPRSLTPARKVELMLQQASNLGGHAGSVDYEYGYLVSFVMGLAARIPEVEQGIDERIAIQLGDLAAREG